jgi:sodium transport system permease protein
VSPPERRPGHRGGGVLATLYLYELRMLARDTRTLLIAIGAPLFLFPVMILVSRAVERRDQREIEEATYRYAVIGTEEAWARRLVERALALQPSESDSALAPASFVEEPVERPDSLVSAGEFELAVEGMTALEYERARELERPDSAAAGLGDDPEDALRVPVLRLHFRSDEDLSRAAAERLRERLERVRREYRDSVYRAHGMPFDPDRVGVLESSNVATAEREGGALLGLILTPLLLFLMLSGGSIVAADAISGEKERGTLETLLTTAARRSEIVNAKQLAVITVGVAVTVINLLNLLVYVVLGWIELPQSLAVSLSGLSLVVLLALFLPLTVLVSSALLLLSGWAKSYKEYQMWFFPLFLMFFVPALAGMLPGMDLRSAIAFVPVAGIGVAVREVMLGELDWPFLGIALASTALTAIGAARLTERALSTERLISAAELDEADLKGGPGLFPRRVLRWFGVIWVVLLLTSLWFGEALGVRGQVLFNLFGLFFVGSLLMVRTYRLDPVQAFALRPPPAAAWPAVLLGAPSALVTGLGISELFQSFVPVPERMLEEFGQLLGADGMPLWQMTLMMAIVPGIFEELAFRGALLHGLSRRLRPVPLALAVGAIFGVFHVTLWRILPTAYLGTLLAGVVLLTGSIFPAMLWHALNNAAALLPVELGWIGPEAALPLWSYPLGVSGLAASFAMLWATRRPYPGLRPPDAVRG